MKITANKNKPIFLVLTILIFAILISGCLTKPGQTGLGKTNTSDNASVDNTTTSVNTTKTAPEEKWDNIQMKFTYIGVQEKLIPSAGISVTPFDMALFKNGTPDVDYSNDGIKLNKIVITKEEMQSVVTAIFDLEFMRTPKAPEDPAVSFMFYNATSGITTEFILSAKNGNVLANTILGSLTVSGQNATKALSGY